MKNFRNFPSREISFWAQRNIIIGDNGKWKSNILEALSLPSAPLVESKPEYLVMKQEETLFLKYILDSWNLSYWYSHDGAKRKYMLLGKSTTKSRLRENYPLVVSFHPMMMNLMYLGPSARRDFLDGILSQSFPLYTKAFSNYKKILTSRNRVLKNISEGKSDISELSFWNNKYIESAEIIYKYRNEIQKFFQENIWELKEYFFWKIENISFQYISKTDLIQPWEYLKTYIDENTQKEILLRKTLRWPHLDDFSIIIADTPLIHFASRWEVKSILLGLKFLETKFLEKYCPDRDILFLIDDFLSELDSRHRDLLWKHIWSRQSIITSINDFPVEWNKIFI